MKRLLLLALLLGAFGPARASVDLAHGSLYRTTGVPDWSPSAGTFTIMLWIYAPGASGANDFFEADNGNGAWLGLGSAADSPSEPYFLTTASEFHFNKDGSFTANPQQSFDITQGWTYLAVSFTNGGATDLYAWQAGVNGGSLVHIPAQSQFSTIGGNGAVTMLVMGNARNFSEGCSACLLGPVYVYNGVALSQAQIDAQRQQAAPLLSGGLIAYSTFTDAASFTSDGSGTADWSVRGSLSAGGSNPPVAGLDAASGSSSSSSSSSSGGGSGGSSSSSSSSGGAVGMDSSGGGAVGPAMLLLLLAAGLRRVGRLRR